MTLKTAAQQALEALESGALLCEVTAASMLRVALEAEQAQAVEPYGWMVQGVPTVMRGSLAQEIQEQKAKRIGGTCKAFPVYLHPAPYDQQALELCDMCGWKAIMPGESCFVCNMQTEVQQVAVPQAMEDLTGVTVCCGDFAKCHRPCTPRGQWIATKAYQVAVPSGYALVPIEPTDAMCEAAWEGEGVDYVGEYQRIHRADLAYKSMITAAPQPPQGDKP